jgi:sugar phosphate isomerase/epimerase
MFSRRDLGKLALGALPMSAIAAKKIDSVFRGVQFGLQSYVFSMVGLPQDSILDVVVKSMVESGLGECDIYLPLLEPAEISDRARAGGPGGPGATVPPEIAAARAQARQELAKWRMSVSLDYFQAIRRKFNDAGIEIYGLSGFPGSTEEELDRTCDIAGAFGAQLITLGIPLSAAKRVAPLAEKRGVKVGLQGRPDMSVTNPDVVAKPENFEAAAALSKAYCISIDVGDATGGGWDSLKFVENHHDRIALIYLKDRRKDRLSVPWGEGDTPLKEILRLIRDKKYPIRCYIDCDYKTGNRPADVKRSFEYAKAALA